MYLLRRNYMPPTYNLSNQEYLIMKLFWNSLSEMTLGEVSEALHSQGFRPTTGTIKTYLTRLVKKEALTARKEGHKLLYFPTCPEETYAQKWTQSILDENFNGSLNNFICALTGKSKLTTDEIKFLRDLYYE